MRVSRYRSTGCVWSAGEIVAGREGDSYTVTMCVKARVVGPRGGVREPAELVEIAAPTVGDAYDAIQAEGFERPDAPGSVFFGTRP